MNYKADYTEVRCTYDLINKILRAYRMSSYVRRIQRSASTLTLRSCGTQSTRIVSQVETPSDSYLVTFLASFSLSVQTHSNKENTLLN